MAELPELQSPTARAIEALYFDRQEPVDHPTLRCSKIGEPCERALWYTFRWTTPLQRHPGRLERLFQTGHREEARMVEDLRAIGCEVQDRDPETGEQWRAIFLNGLFTGSADGKIIGVLGAEKTPHLLECKTHNDKSFQDWKRNGVEKSKPLHWAQMQAYMHGLGLARALYVAHNKNTDQVEVERVHADPLAGSAIVAKAERIIRAAEPPPRVEGYYCRWCPHEPVCKDGAWSRTHCRTCFRFALNPTNGAYPFHCERDGHRLSCDDQRAGCKKHLFIPALVPGAQVDVDDAAETVTYELPGGGVWIDGLNAKPNVLAVLA